MYNKTYCWRNIPIAKSFASKKKKKTLDWHLFPPYDVLLLFLKAEYTVYLEDGSVDEEIQTITQLRSKIWGTDPANT